MGLIDRAKNIIMKPRQEWQVIDAETATVGGLYTGYVIPLSLLAVIAGALGLLLFGYSVPLFGKVSIPTSTVLGSAAVQFVGGLIGIYIIALVIDALAPSFGGTKSPIQAMKVAAYSYTGWWVFGILNIIPSLRLPAFLLGLYSLYLLFTGLPALMKAPPEKSLGYTAVTVIVAILVYICIGLLIGALGFGLSATMPHAAG
ncbi:MAG TPA: Yip1 family protein [Gemmatimonadaceae bacterium]|nr:Yip1 family protein [Gemmatimonadaceae bacterium]